MNTAIFFTHYTHAPLIRQSGDTLPVGKNKGFFYQMVPDFLCICQSGHKYDFFSIKGVSLLKHGKLVLFGHQSLISVDGVA